MSRAPELWHSVSGRVYDVVHKKSQCHSEHKRKKRLVITSNEEIVENCIEVEKTRG